LPSATQFFRDGLWIDQDFRNEVLKIFPSFDLWKVIALCDVFPKGVAVRDLFRNSTRTLLIHGHKSQISGAGAHPRTRKPGFSTLVTSRWLSVATDRFLTAGFSANRSPANRFLSDPDLS